MVKDSYWLEEGLISGDDQRMRDGGICIVGSGLSGVSTAYWLQQLGYDDITICDDQPECAASFRNCGHILYGSVESMEALVALHGRAIAEEIWSFSVELCNEVKETVSRHDLNVDYFQNGYLCVAIDETEDKEIKSSIDLLNSMNFESVYWDAQKIKNLGFRNCFGGRFEAGSARAHPLKFRNELLRQVLSKGAKYHSSSKVLDVSTKNDQVFVSTQNGSQKFDAVVIATNAYSPLFLDFFKPLVVPFRGQIITSAPILDFELVPYAHSFDHGYEYALSLPGNRLMIGGWRNNTKEGEVGTYNLTPNEEVVQGLKDFAMTYYGVSESLTWDHSWAGIMASSKTAFPFIGPTSDPRIFSCCGFTGHGFSWAHGSAKLLAQIILGEEIPGVARLFKPQQI